MTAGELLRGRVRHEDLAVLPLERSETIPSSWYTDPAFHEIDRSTVFERTWQFIGHACNVRHAGDQRPAVAAGNPVVTVRDAGGEVRTFYNVCKHRGGPLTLEDCNAKVMQCKYHGWTYLLDGSLRGTPKFDRTELFDRKDFGLERVRTGTWEGLMFGCIGDPVASLEEVVDGIAASMRPLTLADRRFAHRVVYRVQANWKVYVDNYLEGYHLPFVHPELTDLLDYQNYVTETGAWHSLQYSDIARSGGQYGAGRALYYFVFPNFMLNILPGGRLQTNLVMPVAADACDVVFEYYYDDVASPEAAIRISEDVSTSDRVQKEDAEICEAVQRGLASRAYDRGRFSADMESGVHHFQSLLKRMYAEALGR